MTKEQQGVALVLSLIMLGYFIWESSFLFPPASLEKINGGRLTQISSIANYKSAAGSELIDALAKRALTKENQSSDLEREDQEGVERSNLHLSEGRTSPRSTSGQSINLPQLPALLMPININKASGDELSTLPGIGPKTAQAILAFREAHGPFKSAEDLLQVRGLGPKKLAAIRERITVQ